MNEGWLPVADKAVLLTHSKVSCDVSIVYQHLTDRGTLAESGGIRSSLCRSNNACGRQMVNVAAVESRLLDMPPINRPEGPLPRNLRMKQAE
jgi:hypothetical protein